ncbi:MAG: response regulator [Bacteroidetes bacterium]|jgi:CheY-like chemotaxis protein|nr:response regulator [Bacteroidota bacterium]MBT3748486.1 response regulator [Bacteroidota bacterium]MBT4399680.1 response regulator [Bacteroidota bacterium]MBT4409567.1 response regulator [Bacteroidota bacterium]MBT5426776.1 response regulator [Bacteroidota bacterium]
MVIDYSRLPILLVEDNPVDIDLSLRAFKKQNITNPVDIARDGEEALEYIKKWDAGRQIPIVILLDLKLPKLDGLQVLEAYKKHPIYNTIPVVVLTTSSDNRDVERAYKIGANSYIIKPVNFTKFVEVASQIELYWTVLNKAHI